MRTPNHIKIRYIMLSHFEKGWSAADSFRDLTQTYGQGIIGQTTVREWFARFKAGHTDVKDKRGRGRTSQLNDNDLLQTIEQDGSQTTRMLADEFGVNQATIVNHLHKVGKASVWKIGGLLPPQLTEEQPKMTSNGTHCKVLSPQKSNRSTDLSSVNDGASTSSPHSLHSLPFSKIKAIMASAADSLKANDEGLFAMTKATEAFVMMLARGAYDHTQNGTRLTYNALADFVQSNEDLVHIHEMVPRKVKFSTIENQLDT